MKIKFRVWDKKTNQMGKVGAVYFSDSYELEAVSIHLPNGLVVTRNINDCIVMQSTGLKDKKSLVIFEGDLVEHDDNINGDWETFEACEVEYDEDYAQFCFKGDASNFLSDYRNLNVVSNIYENPELLTEG